MNLETDCDVNIVQSQNLIQYVFLNDKTWGYCNQCPQAVEDVQAIQINFVF